MVAAGLLLIAVPVAVSLLRAPHFETTLAVSPREPPGNAGVSSAAGRAVPGIVANSGFQDDVKGWRAHAGFSLSHSTDESHSGTASLLSVRTGRSPSGGRAASTHVVLPGAGRYRLQAWVRLPRGYSGAAPTVELAGVQRSRRLALQAGDPRAQGRWQSISSDYRVGPGGAKGLIVLRTGSRAPAREQALHWDDVTVSSTARPRAPSRVNLVSNGGFEYDLAGWGNPPVYGILRSIRLAHAGDASLRSYTDKQSVSDSNAGHTYVAFNRPGTYRAQAWAYIPRRGRRIQPAVVLDGFYASRQIRQRLADPDLRNTWQLVWTDYAISAQDLEGSLVLRNLPAPDDAGGGIDGRVLVYWDDISVPAPPPELPRDVRAVAESVRSALEEPQVRFEVAQATGDDTLYDPRRATVLRSPRADGLTFLVRVAADVPSEAHSLQAPLRTALVRAARRSTLRRAQGEWQELVSALGRSLTPGQRDQLQRRANVLQRAIGAQAADAVVLPGAVGEQSVAARRDEQRIQSNRHKVISRLGEDLPARQRRLVQQRADDLQRLLGAQTAEYVVLPAGRRPRATRPVDRLLDSLPVPFPARVGPLAAGAAGSIAALLLLGMLLTTSAVRERAPRAGVQR